jgi:D-amino-acid dehydrogenase
MQEGSGMKREADVLIIGGGVIGICAAHYLLEKGRQVVVVEQGEVCSGSSYGNAGLIVPSHSVPLAEPGVISQGLRWMFDSRSPFYIKPRLDRELISWLWKFRRSCSERNVRRSMPILRDLSLESLRLFQELDACGELEFDFEQRGALYICKTESALEHVVEEAQRIRSVGLEAEILDATQVQELESDIRLDVVGGVLYPQDAHLDPARFVRALARLAEEGGVEIHSSTEVLGFTCSGESIATVRTTRGEIAVAEVVLAGGAWSPGIARDLGIDLPIQPAKGYSVTVERPPNCPARPLMLAGARVGVTPMGDMLRFAGTLELAGMDLSINQRRVDAILQAVPAYLPDLDPARLELVEIWRGLRPCTPDGLPFLGRSRRYGNLTVAAGHAMVGLSLGPISGAVVSRLVVGEEPGFDLELLRPERFA